MNQANRIDSSRQQSISSAERKSADNADSGTFKQAMEKENTNQDQILGMIIKLLEQLINALTGGAERGKSQGGSIPANGGGASAVNGGGPGGSAGSDELIPKPSEHLQTLNLGGKQVVVGGDGTASAEEVQATASQIQNMYENSPTFRNMIDNSSDPSFEVSVGRRSDNTSWGNSNGRVFMNINNIDPGNSDSFQSLLAHEFAHASIDLGHGGQMEQLEQAAAAEA